MHNYDCLYTQGIFESDYCEFTELSLVFLSNAKREVSFRCPGALHKARWKAKVIYSLEIAAKSIEQLPPRTITFYTFVRLFSL